MDEDVAFPFELIFGDGFRHSAFKLARESHDPDHRSVAALEGPWRGRVTSDKKGRAGACGPFEVWTGPARKGPEE